MVQWEWIRRCFSICEGWWGWDLGQGSSTEVGLLEGSMRVWKADWCWGYVPGLWRGAAWLEIPLPQPGDLGQATLPRCASVFPPVRWGYNRTYVTELLGRSRGMVYVQNEGSIWSLKESGKQHLKGTAQAPELYPESQLSSLPGPVMLG